jgi:phosphoadenosine phosphosulfate reductase
MNVIEVSSLPADPMISPAELLALRAELAALDPPGVLRWAQARFGAGAAIASSFGVEDLVLIDLARAHAPDLRVFTLDTGRLHPETYEQMDVVRNRYGVEVETFLPDHQGVERLERAHGFFSFRQSLEARQACCALRKREPLERALRGRSAWLTGIRREQSLTRARVEVLEFDAVHGLWKLNPLATWSSAQVWAYVKDNGVPYHSLHDVGFSSIGCAPCTRAVRPYEDARAGRWWWESPETRECGLHPSR